MKKTDKTNDPNDVLWNAILDRDPRFDGFLYYGVITTGVFCKPTCPSPRPKRTNARFFMERDAAGEAGFRPCKRCKPDAIDDPDGDVARVLDAVRYIQDQESLSPTLKVLSAHVGLSPQHFQKLFKATLGVSPQQYATALRMARFKEQVRAGESIAGASMDAGFGSSSRLYEKAGEHLGMTPGRYKRKGKGLVIRYAHRDTALGTLLIAATERGLCSVQLGDKSAPLLAFLMSEFSEATVIHDPPTLESWLDAFSEYLDGHARLPEFPLDIQATAFQARVWQALRNVPHGTTLNYSSLAKAIGDPNATRAVASACARNPVALTIPCHRIVPRSGGFGGYRWEPERKRRLLEIERLS
jgi:AraC family transcriptional regulator, regulatory protein of adaptative response / methylated-DNA-[protein]-cysteine methyltransferase